MHLRRAIKYFDRDVFKSLAACQRKIFLSGPVTSSAARHLCTSKPLPSIGANTQEFSVSTYGSLLVNGSCMKLKVQPFSPAENPAQDKALIEVTDEWEKTSVTPVESESGVTKLKVSGVSSTCRALIPLKFDVGLYLQGESAVEIDSLENELIDVSLQQGSCHMRNIKSHSLKVTTEGAHVNSSSALQADILIQTDQGCIELEKLIGRSLYVETSCGDITLGSLYSQSSHCVTKTGDIHIKNCHGDAKCDITEEGNFNIGSLDGHLKADVNCGNVDVYLSKHEQVYIHVNRGDVVVRMPVGLPSLIDLTASTVNIDPDLCPFDLVTTNTNGQLHMKGSIPASQDSSSLDSSHIGSSHKTASHQWKSVTEQHSPGTVKIIALNGSIKLQTQSWFQSLKFNQTVPS